MLKNMEINAGGFLRAESDQAAMREGLSFFITNLMMLQTSWFDFLKLYLLLQ